MVQSAQPYDNLNEQDDDATSTAPAPGGTNEGSGDGSDEVSSPQLTIQGQGPDNLYISFSERSHSFLTSQVPIPIRVYWEGRSSCEKGLSVLLVIMSIFSLIFAILFFKSLAAGPPGPIANITLSPCINDICQTKECIRISNNLLQSINSSVDPCEDFYQYACGGWIANNPLPAEYSRYSTFRKLGEQNQEVLRKIFGVKNVTFEIEAVQKAKLFYDSCMDTASMDKLGNKPLVDLMDKFGGWSLTLAPVNDSFLTSWSYLDELIAMDRRHAGALFVAALATDAKKYGVRALGLSQGGLSILNREVYINTTVENDTVLQAYITLMTDVYMLTYEDENRAMVREAMTDIIRFEQEIAMISLPAAELRNPFKMYNFYTISNLTTMKSDQSDAISIDWLKFFHGISKPYNVELTGSEPVIVEVPTFFTGLSQLLAKYLATTASRRVLFNYLRWSELAGYAGYLSTDYRNAVYKWSLAYTGSRGDMARWKVCISVITKYFSYATGRVFADAVFPTKTKDTALRLIKAIRGAFERNLPSMKWMDQETKKRALEKVEKVGYKIGFANFTFNDSAINEKYDGLVVGSDYFNNSIAMRNHLTLRAWRDFRKPIDRTVFGMFPSQVNAYYSQDFNEMAFPAGILQPPFYDEFQPSALNFGAIGVVVGHELTHGFDDQGAMYDELGLLDDWWSKSSEKKFKELTSGIRDQYSEYQIDGKHVNGQLTLGENIADNGGLKFAYQAFHNMSERKVVKLPGVNFTDDQLFFLGFAQVWCNRATTKEDKILIDSNPHAPPQFRVIGTLSNFNEFAKAFKCRSGSPLNPKKKHRVW